MRTLAALVLLALLAGCGIKDDPLPVEPEATSDEPA